MRNGRPEGGAELSAYHDGELKGLARWRLERRLRRSPALRRELAALGRMGRWVRDQEGEAAAPDLWDRIALRLPAVDARRSQQARPRSLRWLPPLGAAVAAAAALLLAVYSGVFEARPDGTGVVRWIDSGGRPVLVLEDDGEAQVTIIWVLEEAVEGAARGGGRELA